MEHTSVADREKRLVAMSSVLAAIFLTGMKLVIGLLTGSLGILAEAAHSGLDLVAAAVTYIAVRVSGHPPDIDHHYGHGKVENLSAAIETLLLLITCVWIVWEAINRLSHNVHVEVTYWSFAVMIVSIVIDLTRSRALMRMARKHSSQALEADALHFSTDVWSSCVVILGLIGVFFAQRTAQSSPALSAWLYRADAMAALGVSMIVVYVSLRLGHRTVDVLLDRAPKGLTERIQDELHKLGGVAEVRRVRVRQSGPVVFVDVTLAVHRGASMEKAHHIATDAEEVVHSIAPLSDVIVHVDPAVPGDGDLIDTVRSVTAAEGVDVHSLIVREINGKFILEMHAEMPRNLSIKDAHDAVTRLEKTLQTQVPRFNDIVVHIEPAVDGAAPFHEKEVQPAAILDVINRLPAALPRLFDCHNVSILGGEGGLSVSFHCTVSAGLTVDEAHDLTEQTETYLRTKLPGLNHVLIHVEPQETGPGTG